MTHLSRAIRILWLAGLTTFPAMAPALAQTPVFTSMDPVYAQPGDSVTLYGSGFDILETYSVSLEGVGAVVEEVQAGFLRFTVPVGATTAAVDVEVGPGGPVATTGRALTVLRPLTATFHAGLAAVTTAYEVGTLYGDAPPGGPSYPVLVVQGNPTLVIGAGDPDDSNLLAIATDTSVTIELGAHSTAAALVYLTPYGLDGDPAQDDLNLAAIAALAEVSALANLIETATLAGQDYGEDAGFDAAYLGAVMAYLATVPPPGTSAPPPGGTTESAFADDFTTFLEDFTPLSPQDLFEDVLKNVHPLDRMTPLKSTMVTNNKRGVPSRGVTFPVRDTSKGNPVDWVVQLYELDPEAFLSPGQFSALLNDGSVYPRYQEGAVGSLHVSASLSTAKIDIIARLKNWLTSQVLSSPELKVPAERSGLYIARGFSGAYYPSQDALIAGLPEGAIEDATALGLNLSLAVVDAVGIVFSAADVLGENKVAEIILAVEKGIANAIRSQVATGGIDWSIVYALYEQGVKVAVSQIVDAIKKQGVLKAFGALGKTVLKVVDIPGKLASIGAVIERLGALSNIPGFDTLNVIQAVESHTVSMGDPFSPVVTSFEPRSGHVGSVITINGYGFSPVPNENIVEFNLSLGTDINRAPVLNKFGIVLGSNTTSLTVEVPALADISPPASGFLTVRRVGRGGATTQGLPSPNNIFTVLGDPVITGVSPTTPVVGRIFTILGENFSEERIRNKVMLDVGGTFYPVDPISSTDTKITVRAITTAQPTTVQVKIQTDDDAKSRFSNLFPVTASVPSGGGQGVVFFVGSLTDGDVADGIMTLREAIGFAAGTLGREPTKRPQGVMTGAYESDFIDPYAYPYPVGVWGAALRDIITLEGHPPGTIFTLSGGPLPPVGDFDELYFGQNIVDGTGATGDGLTLSGDRNYVEDLELRNIAGNGIRLTGAEGTRLKNVTVATCGGSGLVLDGDSSSNLIDNLSVNDCRDHGVHLTGSGVTGNEFGHGFGLITDNDKYGVKIDLGASANLLHPGDITLNDLGGIHIDDATSTDNYIGIPELSAPLADRMQVHGNLGPGIQSSASRTSVRFIEVTGNTGDGILLTGPGNTGSTIESCRIGIDGNAALSANTGSGIHLKGGVSDALIGTEPILGFNVGNPNAIGGNTEHGIWLEGPNVSEVRIKHSRIGAAFEPTTYPVPAIIPNGMHGIAVTNGAHDNEIGEVETVFSVEVVGHTAGAGIYFSDAGTSGNAVFGSYVGNLYRGEWWPWTWDGVLKNQNGIWITNGAHSNVIGRRGWYTWIPDEFDNTLYERDSVNYILTNDIGILIESGGPTGTITPGTTPDGGNVVQNNVIGAWVVGSGNGIGVLLRGGARANRIGGTQYAESNTFYRNRQAGIQIDGIDITTPNLANRITSNEFYDNMGTFVPPDPATQIPDGVAVLVTNSSGHVIGGETITERNFIEQNRVGIYVSGSSDIEIQRNKIGRTLSRRNFLAGVILSDSNGCSVWRNQIAGNGRGQAGAMGGLIIQGGGEHEVSGNLIGLRTDGFIAGNEPYGIHVRDSNGNTIGSRKTSDQNVIIDNLSDGVRIEGSGSTGNKVAGNWIGQNPETLELRPNAAAGVRILGGAQNNSVGGTLELKEKDGTLNLPAGNTIVGNLGSGVVIDGPMTLGNLISNNSITGHPGLGIDNTNGGNGEPVPPVLTSVVAGDVLGTVDASIPDGSVIQIFSDSADEGEVLMAETTVALGMFSASLGFIGGNQLHATVTHAGTGSTSEFGAVLALSGALDISKATTVVVDPDAPAGLKDRVVLPLDLRALELPARAISLRVDASGSLPDHTAVLGVRVYEDRDGDAEVSDGDALLAGPGMFPADDGFIDLNIANGAISTSSPKRWLVTYDLAAGAPEAMSFQVTVTAATSVGAELALVPGSPVPVTGTFPITSDVLTVTQALPNPDVLSVSGDPLDWADFPTVQSAVDAINREGVIIQILPGPSGVYYENLIIDGTFAFTLSGTGGVVTLDGNLGAAITVLSTVGSEPVAIEDLTLRGQTGVHALVSTRIEDVQFELVAGTALDLDGGDHELRSVTMDGTVVNGIDLASGATLSASRIQIQNVMGTAAFVDGPAFIDTSLFTGTANGLVLGSGGTLDLRHSTLADGVGVGVDNLAGGIVSLYSNIVWNHAGGDLDGVNCLDVAWSNVGSPDCSGADGNQSLTPLFELPGTDYRLASGSPLLDLGPGPSLFSGSPCTDLDGDLRGRDHDGDGVPQLDPGAYERRGALLPPPVDGLRWLDNDTLTWDQEPSAGQYHLYSGVVQDLTFADSGSCIDSQDPDLTDLIFIDPGPPSILDEVRFYLVVADDGAQQGAAGEGTCTERRVGLVCP